MFAQTFSACLVWNIQTNKLFNQVHKAYAFINILNILFDQANKKQTYCWYKVQTFVLKKLVIIEPLDNKSPSS